MAKKTFTRITASLQSWDADLNNNYDIQELGPLPVYENATLGSFPAANQNDRSIGFTNDGTAGWLLVMSDGTVWAKIGKQGVTVNALTDSSGGTSGGDTIAAVADPADTPITADALRDDLVANTIPQLRNAIATLSAKVNAYRTSLRNAGVIA